MKRTETRLENLERAVVSGEDVMAVHWYDSDTVTLSLPVSRRGEIMSLADFEQEFPDATLIQVEWETIENLNPGSRKTART